MYAHINLTQKKTRKNNNNIKKFREKNEKKYKNCAICTLTKSPVKKIQKNNNITLFLNSRPLVANTIRIPQYLLYFVIFRNQISVNLK